MFNLQKMQTKKYLSFGIPILVFLGIAWKLSDELTSNYFEQTHLFLDSNSVDFNFLILIIACSLFNWSLEALKWKKLVSPVEKMSFKKALKSVFVGLSLGFFTPRSIGDYFGRAVLLDSKDKLQILGGLLVSRLSQMLATVFSGILGLVYLKGYSFERDYILVFWSGIVIFVLIFMFFFFRKMIIQRMANFSKLKKIVSFIYVIRDYKNRLYWKVLILSFIRYGTFLLQFVLVSFLFKVSVDLWPFLAVVSGVLLFKSIMPSFNFFSDLGVRGVGSLMLFPLIGINSEVGVSIGLVVWVVNVLLPSLIGAILTWKIKWEW